MASLNKVTIIGNLGKDPEVRTFENGNRVANFSVATTESWKDKSSGEKKEKTEWHSVNVTNPALVGICEKYLKRGNKVYIEGQIESRKYQKDGMEKTAFGIAVKPFGGSIILLGGSHGAQTESQSNEPSEQKGSFDDEIPF